MPARVWVLYLWRSCCIVAAKTRQQHVLAVVAMNLTELATSPRHHARVSP